MKNISLMVSLIYFFSLVPSTGRGASSIDEDMRVQWAEQLENTGKTYQGEADQKGLSIAKEHFREEFEQNLEKLSTAAMEQIERLSELESEQLIAGLQRNILPENIFQILEDRSLTAKAKLREVFRQSFQGSMTSYLGNVLQEIDEVGFEKTFSKMGDALRSRASADDVLEAGVMIIVLLSIPVLFVAIPYFVITGKDLFSGFSSSWGGGVVLGVWLLMFLLFWMSD